FVYLVSVNPTTFRDEPKKGVYPVVNDRILQALPTQQARIPPAFLPSGGILAIVGFVSGLREPALTRTPLARRTFDSI
ncbi:MAG: hypothetical protein Q4C10_08990, partial [Clostridia bacterium]|nr:hypothetical protein [Clostridia bacterium]